MAKHQSSITENPDPISISFTASLRNACGPIPYGMTNDYMFRAVLQSSNKVLRRLIGSLLHLADDDILSVEITNPIILGESAESKEFRLDINILLNNHILINLEMQIANKLNWENRSLLYLCRSFDQLNRGQDYCEAKSAIHIGFLDYTLFTDCPEFYATYKLINVRTLDGTVLKNGHKKDKECQKKLLGKSSPKTAGEKAKKHYLYSDNFTLSVVDLSKIDLATDEDKKYKVDDWARLFKATTWEEVKMLASQNEYLTEAANTMFRLSTDEQIRKRCRDREEYYQDLRNYERVIAEKDALLNKALAENAKKDAEKEKALAEQAALIQQLYAEIDKLKT